MTIDYRLSVVVIAIFALWHRPPFYFCVMYCLWSGLHVSHALLDEMIDGCLRSDSPSLSLSLSLSFIAC